MVRLVFRPYTQVRRTICTSVSLRASTRVSPGLALLTHSSPSFGSQQLRSHSNLSWMIDRSIVLPHRSAKLPTSAIQMDHLHFHSAPGFSNPNACAKVRLLGPCFKTGHWKLFRQDRERPCQIPSPNAKSIHRQNFVLSTSLIKQRQGSAASRRSFCSDYLSQWQEILHQAIRVETTYLPNAFRSRKQH